MIGVLQTKGISNVPLMNIVRELIDIAVAVTGAHQMDIGIGTDRIIGSGNAEGSAQDSYWLNPRDTTPSRTNKSCKSVCACVDSRIACPEVITTRWSKLIGRPEGERLGSCSMSGHRGDLVGRPIASRVSITPEHRKTGRESVIDANACRIEVRRKRRIVRGKLEESRLIRCRVRWFSVRECRQHCGYGTRNRGGSVTQKGENTTLTGRATNLRHKLISLRRLLINV